MSRTFLRQTLFRIQAMLLIATWVALVRVPVLSQVPQSNSSLPAAGQKTNQNAQAIGAKIKFPEPNHNFGTVTQAHVVRHEFKFLNVGDQVLEIKDVKPACGCTTAGQWTRSIPPGSSGMIPIQLDTARFSGPVTKTISVTSNDRLTPLSVLQISANIWTPIQLSNSVLVFPALTNSNQILTRTSTIRNQLEMTIQITEVKSDSATLKPEVREVIPGKEFELLVTTVPPLTNGTHIGKISIKTSSPQMPLLSATAVATVLPPVQVAPNQITLPGPKLSRMEKRHVVILNHRANDLHVSDLKLNAEGVLISTNLNPGGRQITVTLTFPVGFNAPESQKLVLSGKTSHPELPTFEVPIIYAKTP
ncbi:MAG: DUF1573 domain-containing protein [Verrucomicrobiota bacterium]